MVIAQMFNQPHMKILFQILSLLQIRIPIQILGKIKTPMNLLIPTTHTTSESDSFGTILVTHLLDNTNYYAKARSMKRALRIKNKLGFVDGS